MSSGIAAKYFVPTMTATVPEKLKSPSKAASSNFRPPLECKPVLWLARACLPLVLGRRAVSRIEIEPSDIERLRALRDERVVLTPNHPTNTDPALIFELSRRAQMPFHYLACREAFDGWRGVWGVLIQRIGAYSVVRGTVDRESFRYTRALLARPQTKLVIFPEGEVYSQNESLLPFQTGAVQLAMWGREEARKTDPKAQVLLLPCAIRYHFAGDVSATLERKLAALEKHLALDQSTLDVYARMRGVALCVLRAVEAEYHLQAPPDDGHDPQNNDLTPRIEAAKHAALERAAHLLGVKLPRGTLPEQMRSLLHTAEMEMHEDEAHRPQSLALQHLERARLASHDLTRLANWIAVHDGYVLHKDDGANAQRSSERIAEVLFRLEQEVFGKATYAGPRIARVRIGEPIILPDELDRKGLTEWTQKLEESVRALLLSE